MTVDEKRKLELKLCTKLLASIVIISTILLRVSYVRIAKRFGNMQSIALMHVLIWKVKHSVVYVKPIAMHLLIVKKSVKLCVMVDQGCYWYRRSKSLDICILNGKTKKEASHASLFLMVLSRFHVIILCDCFVQYSFD